MCYIHVYIRVCLGKLNKTDPLYSKASPNPRILNIVHVGIAGSCTYL